MNCLLTALRSAALLGVTALILSGCSTTPSAPIITKADYREFTDASWAPENALRAPFGSPEIVIDPVLELQAGVYAYYTDHRSIFKLEAIDRATWHAIETIDEAAERTFTWGSGASHIIRNGRTLVNQGSVLASRLPDGSVMLQNDGEAKFNMALTLRAYDISGKPMRHFLRHGNNRPAKLAWFVPADAVFPKGSVAYIAVYRLGDDEVVRPSSSAFTGASSLERLIMQFSKATPYCMSYINHTKAVPYGLRFTREMKKPGRRNEPATGTFSLERTDRGNIFCESLAGEQPETHGTWKIIRVQGTRVLLLEPDASIDKSNLGVLPINAASVSVGFAEVVHGEGRKAKLAVVPVRIVHNNRPLTDFRLKFNRNAADALEMVLHKAASDKATYEANQKAAKQ